MVEPGTVVTAVIAGGEETFLLGNREIAGGTELDVYSEVSPLGEAILGRKEGEKVSYTAPNGKEIAVELKNDVRPPSTRAVALARGASNMTRPRWLSRARRRSR